MHLSFILKNFNKTESHHHQIVRGSITVPLTSCLTGLALAEWVILLLINHKQRAESKPAKTLGQPYNDTSPYGERECSLDKVIF